MSRLLIDIGSTYFKISSNGQIDQYLRNFDTSIHDDLSHKCSEVLTKYKKEDTFICSSANGGLSTLIIGLTNSFSLKYATNIAFNSGINIIDTILYPKIKEYSLPSEVIDVVIVVGGIDGVGNVFDEQLIKFLDRVNYQNIVYVGSGTNREFLEKNIPSIKILKNIITYKLQVFEDELKEYLTNLYQEDIIGKQDIKQLYDVTDNQIYPTPYIVNKSMSSLGEYFDVVDPFILIDIGGATTDIHYSKDLISDNILSSNEYDRLVFKKLGVYKSRQSLIFSAKNNEFVYEFLSYMDVTENILEEQSEQALKILMQLSIFLVLYKMSKQHTAYIDLKLQRVKSIVFTGGTTKVLSYEQIQKTVLFFYKKILNYHQTPKIIIDKEYMVWTIGV